MLITHQQAFLHLRPGLGGITPGYYLEVDQETLIYWNHSWDNFSILVDLVDRVEHQADQRLGFLNLLKK